MRYIYLSIVILFNKLISYSYSYVINLKDNNTYNFSIEIKNNNSKNSSLRQLGSEDNLIENNIKLGAKRVALFGIHFEGNYLDT